MLDQFVHELVHHPLDRLGRERAKGDGRVQAVAKLRAEELFQRLLALASVRPLAKADRRRRYFSRTGVAGHDQDNVAEIRFLAVVVGERGVVHHLEQDVEQVWMGLFDLIK